VLRFRLELLDPARHLARFDQIIIEHARSATECAGGWKGVFCSVVATDLEVVVHFSRDNAADADVSPPKAGGRSPGVFRGGLGTHVAATAVGQAFFGQDASGEAGPATRDKLGRRIQDYDAAARSAKLAFFDIGREPHPYLLPPSSLARMYQTAYEEAGARVFLHAWTCHDVVWWDNFEDQSDPATRVGLNPELRALRTICNRYTSQTADTDDFVFRNPDMVVVVPAGDSGAIPGRGREEENADDDEIPAPGTCKNCITVGLAMTWEEEAANVADFFLSPCRPDDCPRLQRLASPLPCRLVLASQLPPEPPPTQSPCPLLPPHRLLHHHGCAQAADRARTRAPSLPCCCERSKRGAQGGITIFESRAPKDGFRLLKLTPLFAIVLPKLTHNVVSSRAFDQSERRACGSAAAANPFQTPSCCAPSHPPGLTHPSHVHPFSSHGGAIDAQSPWVPTDPVPIDPAARVGIFGDTDSVSFRRIKPDLLGENPALASISPYFIIHALPLRFCIVVILHHKAKTIASTPAPGVGIVSARSDGNTASGGTHGRLAFVLMY
jgi:hypothetical protein